MPTVSLGARARHWFGRTRSGRGRVGAGWPGRLARRLAPVPVPPGGRRAALRERDHVILLGWSDQVFAILSVLVEAAAGRGGGCLALLADRDPGGMAAEIRARVGPTGATRLVCRRGDPADPDEVAAVSPHQARSVVVLAPAGRPADRDAYLVKTLLAVARSRPVAIGTGPVAGCVSDPANLPAARLASGQYAHLVDATGLAARLLVQAGRQPGLAVVHAILLDTGGARVRVQAEPALVGRTYGQVVHAYRTSSVIGLRTADGRTALNPHSQTPVQPGDRVITIADDRPVELTPSPAPIVGPALVACPDPTPSRRRALVLGWNDRGPGVIGQLDQQLPPGSEVSVLTRHPDAGQCLSQLTGQMVNLVLTHRAGDHTGRTVLESLGAGGYDHALVLSDGAADPQLADARTLITMLHLGDLDQRAGASRCTVVGELADHRNRGLAPVGRSGEVVAGAWLASLLVGRIAGDPTGGAVLAGLLEATGPELRLKAAEWYVQPAQPINFQTVVEAARWRWETAIGYRVAAHSHEPPWFGVVVNPDKAAPLTLEPGDQVIVLADH